jgi:hypothetical protein
VPSSALLDVHFELTQLVRVGPGVVPAEQELATARKYGANLCSRSTAVTAVGEGQLGPGQGSRLHSCGLPPSRYRVPPVPLAVTTAHAVRPLLQTFDTPACVPVPCRDDNHVSTLGGRVTVAAVAVR